jgi:hypothetical protein
MQNLILNLCVHVHLILSSLCNIAHSYFLLILIVML